MTYAPSPSVPADLQPGVERAGDGLTVTRTASDLSVVFDVPPAQPQVIAPQPRLAKPEGRRPRTSVVASSLSLLALALFAFLADVSVVSTVEHARSQRVAYAGFRTDLSALTAPTGQTDFEGQLLALGAPVAFMTVPELGLEREVVFEGTTASVLAKGPGHRRSSVLPGQPGVSILYGRAWSYGGPFGGAGDLARGSEIRVTTGQGEHTYRVVGLRREGAPVPPPPAAAAGEGRLTLVTATGAPYAPDGVVYVDAELTSPAVPAAPRVLASSALSPTEDALAGDSSAWPTVFLTLQGLAAASLAVAWASRRWGSAQAWLVGFPLIGLFAVLASREILRLLPNLL